MSLPPSVSLTVGTYDFTNEPDLNLEHSTESPGGFRDCTFDLCNVVPPFDLGDLVRIYHGGTGRYAFIGAVNDIRKKGSKFSITAVRSTRYQVHKASTVPQDITHPSGVIAGKVYKPGTPLVEALRDGLQLCEQVFDGGPVVGFGIDDPGVQFVADSNNMAGWNAEQVWNYVASLLNSLVYLWHVYGSVGSGLQLVRIGAQDLAARYQIDGVSEDDISELFTADAIATRVAVEWGNDQVWIESVASPQLGITHDIFTQGANNLTRLQDAQGAAGRMLAKFSQFRSVNDSIELDCVKHTVRVLPPLVTVPTDDWPLCLVEAGRGCLILNRPSGQYYPQLKYITGTRYNWTTGKLSLTCGEVINIGTQTQNIVDYNVNRMFYGPASGANPRWQNHPLFDTDTLQVFGPEFTPPQGTPSNPNPGPDGVAGIGILVQNDGDTNSTQTPYDRVYHPGLIADEGLEINYSFDITGAGWKGGTWSIPGKLTYMKLSMWKHDAANGLQADTVEFDIYTRVANQAVPTFLKNVVVTATAETIVLINPNVTFSDRNTQIVFRVVTPATLAEVINVTLHGIRHYPGLKV